MERMYSKTFYFFLPTYLMYQHLLALQRFTEVNKYNARCK